MVTTAHMGSAGGQGVLTRITVEIYWVMLLSVLFVLACIPSLAIALVMAPGRPSLLMVGIALVPIGPALAAAMFAWREREVAEDPAPLRSFVRGYRLSGLDGLKVWLVLLVAMTVVFGGIMAADAGLVPRPYRILLAAVGVVVLVIAMHALSIATFLRFRTLDAVRLAGMHMVRLPAVSLAVAAVLLCAGAVLYLAGDAAALLAGAVFARVLGRYVDPLVRRVRADFTIRPDPAPADY